MATKTEIDRTWGILCTSYPSYGKDVDPALLKTTLSIYERLLADIPGDVLEAVALQHIASSRFFPTVAELRTLAASLILPAEQTALEAWGKVQDTFTDGRYFQWDDHANTPEFDDPITRAVLKDMGGYWHLYGSIRDPHGNPAADRARFVEAYETRKRRMRDDVLMLPQVRDVAERLRAGQDVPRLPDGNGNGNGRAGDVRALISTLAQSKRPDRS